MKQKDIAIIIVLVFVSGLISFFVSNKFITSPKHDLKAPKIEPISAEFKEPSKKYFNSKAINPTQIIRIYKNENPGPFEKNK